VPKHQHYTTFKKRKGNAQHIGIFGFGIPQLQKSKHQTQTNPKIAKRNVELTFWDFGGSGFHGFKKK
jgi:hypothetical protein